MEDIYNAELVNLSFEYVLKTRYDPDKAVYNPRDAHQIAIDNLAKEMERLVDETPSLKPA